MTDPQVPDDPTAPDDAHEPDHRVALALAAVAVAGMVALAGLLGWLLDVPMLRSTIPGAVEMKVNTAIGLLALACALALTCVPAGSAARRAATALGVLLTAAVVAIGVATLVEYAFNVDIGIDQWLILDTGDAYNAAKGRMSPFSAVALLALSVSVLGLSGVLRAVAVRPAAWLALAIGALSALGHLWTVPLLVTDALVPPVPFNNAVALLLLGVAVLQLAPPDTPLVATRGVGLEARLLGGLLPMAVFIVVGGGLTYQAGRNFSLAMDWVNHTQRVRTELGQTYGAIVDAENSQRAWLYAGSGAPDPALPLRVGEIRRHLIELGGQLADNPSQLRLHAQLQELTERRTGALEVTERIALEQGAARSQLEAGASANTVLMQRIRELIDRMDDAEGELLQRRIDQAQAQRHVTQGLLMVTMLAVMGVFWLLIRSVRREVQGRATAEASLQQLNGELERRVAERTDALRYQQAFLRRVIDASPNLIFAKDRDGRYVLANEAFAKLMDTTVDQLIGRFQDELVASSAEISKYSAEDQVVIDTGRELVIDEETYTTSRGDTVWMSTVKRPIVAPDGNSFLALGVSTDITARRAAEIEVRKLSNDLERRVGERTRALHAINLKLEQARQDADAANRAKSDFLAHMSHEIRTPLNAITGLTHLLQRDATDPSQLDRLDKVSDAARHLLQVISDVLDMSKIEAGKLQLDEGDFDLDALLQRTCDMLSPRVREKGLDIRLDSPGLAHQVRGDATRLSQVLLNLLSNAVRVTDRGSVSLQCTVEREQGTQLLLRFAVQDTGPGMSLSRQAQLFRAFEAGDPPGDAAAGGGTGLGLALSRQIVMAMGSDIAVSSLTGKGTRFWFSVWLSRSMLAADQAPPPPVEERLAALRARHAGRRVLLAEDNLINREVAQDLLMDAGLVVDCAIDGAQALELAQLQRPALVLMDIQMPVMDGLTAARELRRRGDDMPIIAMTAHAFVGDREASLAAGMNDHVTKPVEPGQLYDTLLRWLAPPDAS